MTSKRKIIGLSITLEFYQTEPIGDSIIKAQYGLYFEDKEGNRISNENKYHVDSYSESSSDRFNTFTFDFVNRSYETNEEIFFVIRDAKTMVEIERKEFIIDNPFAGSFDFDI